MPVSLTPTGTTTLLTLKGDFYRFMGEHYSSTATGGSTSKLTDSSLVGYSSETWPTKLEGVQLCVTSGLAMGDLRLLTRVDRSEGDLFPNRAFSASIINTDSYELWGTVINGGMPLTNLFNDVLRTLRPTTDTQIDVVTNQSQYDITAVVQSRRDIRSVYIRSLDPAGLRPYYIRELRRGLEWDAYDRGGASTTSVTLDLFAPRTLNTAIETLWVRADTSFDEFSSDSSTVDSVYRDWLVWEALYELSKRRSSSAADKQRWASLQTRVLDEVIGWRNRWIPREPIQISTFP